jgi:hypothetical protein
MFLVGLLLLTSVSVVIMTRRFWLPRPAPLGWVSEQWLAEHRALRAA